MRCITFVVVVLVSALVLAAPRSKTRPAQDGSGPRAALLMYDKMVGPNESEKALPLYYARTTRERALAQALAKCDGAIANLHAKATARFGADAADTIIRTLDATTTSDINAARIEVHGDTAQVMFPGSSHPTTMVRINDEWKISVKSIFDEMTSPPRSVRLALARVATAANNAAAKIEEGQYSTAQAATKQLESDYQKAFLPSPR